MDEIFTIVMQIRFQLIDYFEIACRQERDNDSKLCTHILPIPTNTALFTLYSNERSKIHKQLLISGGTMQSLSILQKPMVNGREMNYDVKNEKQSMSLTSDSLFQPTPTAKMIFVDHPYYSQTKQCIEVELPRYASISHMPVYSCSCPSLLSYNMSKSNRKETWSLLFTHEKRVESSDCIEVFHRTVERHVNYFLSIQLSILSLPSLRPLSFTHEISFAVVPLPNVITTKETIEEPSLEILVFGVHCHHSTKEALTLAIQTLPLLNPSVHSLKLEQVRKEISLYTDQLNSHTLLPLPNQPQISHRERCRAYSTLHLYDICIRDLVQQPLLSLTVNLSILFGGPVLEKLQFTNKDISNYKILQDTVYYRPLLFSPLTTSQRTISDEPIHWNKEVIEEIQDIDDAKDIQDIKDTEKSGTTPLIIIRKQLIAYADEYLITLQREGLLQHSFSSSSLPPDRVVKLVDNLQEQINSLSTSISITQTSSMLAPLQTSLQSAVTLHALCTLYQGIQADLESIQCMHDYIVEMIHNESYIQILPNDILSYFVSLEKTLLQMTYRSASEELPESASPYHNDKSITERDDIPVTEEQHEEQVQEEKEENPPRTTVIVDDSLLQQHHLLQSLDNEQHISFVCRNLEGMSIIIDIISAILIMKESEISQTQLKTVIDTLTSAVQKYTRILIIVLVEHTEIDTFASNFQYLLAGILFFPAKILLHFCYHTSKMPSIIRNFLDSSPLRDTSWKDTFYKRDYLTDEETDKQQWYATFPFINPFTACFFDSMITPSDLCDLQLPNPWLPDEIVYNIQRILQVSNATVPSEHETYPEKREPLIQVNRKPKRVRLSIDREHAVEGQTKLCWSEFKESKSRLQSPYFKTNLTIDSIDNYDNTTYGQR